MEDRQITILDYMRENKPIEYGFRGCKGCAWYRPESKRCSWAIYEDRPHKEKKDYLYSKCNGFGSFEPDSRVVPRMCANCKWSNVFVYKTKPEYEEGLKKHNGYTRQAADDPLEEPNIYCTHKDGSLNRRTAYKDVEWAGFGVGHWHRQHEWDTCDRWELDREYYGNMEGSDG